MFEIHNTLDVIFLGAFLFGLLFSIAALALGAIDFGADHGGDLGHDSDTGIHNYLNVSVILAFIAWFGGIGYLARNGAGWTAAVSIVVAIAGGLLGAWLIYQIFARIIRPASRTELDPRDFELPGTLARVTSSIRSGGTGEIVYEQNGVRMVHAARSSTDAAIARGVEVVVLRTERGIGIVAPWNELYSGETIPGEPQRIDAVAPESESSHMKSA